MRRSSENITSVGVGSQLSYQIVAVLAQIWPDVFERIAALEGLLITVFAIAVAVPMSWGFTIYGKKKNGG